jgi:nucleoside-diphosphate-sugar epimerase
MKRILVTGGTGKLARAMARLPSRDVEFIYLKGRGSSDLPYWNMATGEVEVEGPFDTILHLAAANPSGDQELKPTSPYGRSKLLMEQKFQAQAADFGIETYTILRLGNLAKYDQLGLAAFGSSQNTLSKVTQFADRSYPKRSYADIDMVLWVIKKLLVKSSPPFMNVASLTAIRLDEYMHALDKHWCDIPADKNVIATASMGCSRLSEFANSEFDLSSSALLKRIKSSL